MDLVIHSTGRGTWLHRQCHHWPKKSSWPVGSHEEYFTTVVINALLAFCSTCEPSKHRDAVQAIMYVCKSLPEGNSHLTKLLPRIVEAFLFSFNAQKRSHS